MQYLGGKTRFAAAIADAVAPVGPWWEPFCGGLSVSVRLAQYGPGLVSDVNPALIALYQAVRGGWKPPTRVTREQYDAAPQLDDSDPRKAFIGFGCSFHGKWMAGYAGPRHLTNHRRQTGGRMFDQVEVRNPPEIAARRVRTNVAAIAGCTIACLDFLDVQPERDRFEAIYCDPPYAGTTSYDGVAAFDHARFWRRCAEWAACGSRVYVSEYAAGDGVRTTCVWAARAHDLRQPGERGHIKRKRTKVERLFRVLNDARPAAAGCRIDPKGPKPAEPDARGDDAHAR